MTTPTHTREDRRKRAAARSIEVLEWARQYMDSAVTALRIVVEENGHAVAALDAAVGDIDKAQTQAYDALSNLKCSR